MRAVGRTFLGVAVLGACSGPTARELFDRDVVPVLEQSCSASACHGVSPEQSEQVDWNAFFLPVDGRGHIASEDQAYMAARRVIRTGGEAQFSTLLRKPLPMHHDGLPHFGGTNFASPSDPSYQAVLRWIHAETSGGEDEPPFNELEQMFADTVQPVLQEATCMTSRCHGPSAGSIPYRLEPAVQGRFSRQATRHNYRETLAMASLEGVSAQSRVLRKALSLGDGIVHKGMNFDFFAGDPGSGRQAIEDWICTERRERTGSSCANSESEALPRQILFVRGPIASGSPFDLSIQAPGTDLWRATFGPALGQLMSQENLTAQLHPEGPADIRDPAVSRDGSRLVFSMRRAGEAGHRLWLMDLHSGVARQVTQSMSGASAWQADRDPVWGPGESIWFVSNRAGVLADGGEFLDPDLYALELTSGSIRRWTYTPHAERRPIFLDVGDEAGGEVAFTGLRDLIASQRRAHPFRFPPDLNTEYHQHFGITPPQTYFDQLGELPDGRYIVVGGNLPARWQSGRLAIIDRNLGPMIADAARVTDSSLERYDSPLVWLEGDGYRDPEPLPDGSLLVAHAEAPPAETLETGTWSSVIEWVQLEERSDGHGPRIRARRVLLAEPGVAYTQPRAILVRGPVRAAVPPPASQTGAVFRHQGMPMIDSILSHLEPTGVRQPRDDMAFVRIIEHVPQSPSARRGLPLSELTVAVPGPATTQGIGGFGPARILAELALAPGGSFYAQVPTGTAFRLQGLDSARMAVGHMHNRWYYTLPGQVLTQGIPSMSGVHLYDTQCASCHGNADGVPGLPPRHADLDATTMASLTLARYQDSNPRRPLPPESTGDHTRLTIDFVETVQPVLARRCVVCHDGGTALPDLRATGTAHFTVAYEQLLQAGEASGGGYAYVDAANGRAHSSFLVELLVGRELDAPGELVGRYASHPGLASGDLTADELLGIVRWIELGAQFTHESRP